MGGDAREWSFPEPFRALLWWPAVSFAVAVLAPDAAIWAIIASGLGLALVGGLGPAVVRRMRRADGGGEPVVGEIPQVKTAA